MLLCGKKQLQYCVGDCKQLLIITIRVVGEYHGGSEFIKEQVLPFNRSVLFEIVIVIALNF